MPGWISNLLAIGAAWFRNVEKADNKRAGAMEGDHAVRDKNAKVRKDADTVWRGKSRGRVRRANGDD